MSEINPLELESILERAAEKGAQKALHSLGLQDDDAPQDVAELRSLLEAWRDVRKTMLQTATGMLTAFLLGALAIGTLSRFWKGE
jgi:type III secretory pathway component EscT